MYSFVHPDDTCILTAESRSMCANLLSTSTLLLLWQILRDGLLLALADPLSPGLFFSAKLELAHPRSQPFIDNAGFNPHALLVRLALAVGGLPPVALFVLGNGCDFRNGPASGSAGVVC
jgi:hypothetical protein